MIIRIMSIKKLENTSVGTHFPWVHICIGNVKRLLLDMHHQLKTSIYSIILMSSVTNLIAVVLAKRWSNGL